MNARWWYGAGSLCYRELIRFLRQRSRVISAFVQPVLLWVLFSAGLRSSFKVGDSSVQFAEFFFPGTMALILLFTAIFSMISVIEDRERGFMQGVLVSPLPRSAIVAGKLAGGTVLAVVPAMMFYLLAPLAGFSISLGSTLATFVVSTLLAYTLSGLGFAIAWPMASTQGFHAVMLLVLMPMWLLSGAFFPAEGALGLVDLLMRLNPLTYGVALLRRAMYLGVEPPIGTPGLALSLVVTALFCVGTSVASFYQVHRGEH